MYVVLEATYTYTQTRASLSCGVSLRACVRVTQVLSLTRSLACVDTGSIRDHPYFHTLIGICCTLTISAGFINGTCVSIVCPTNQPINQMATNLTKLNLP